MTRLVERRGGRRRVLCALGLLALAIGGPAAAGDLLQSGDPALQHPKSDPSIPFDTDLNNYALFALDSINVKGSNVEGRGVIRGGNVGVNTPGFADRGMPRLRMCNGAGDGVAIQMDEGTQVVADTGDIARACVMWDVKLGFCCNDSNPQAHTLTFGTWYPSDAPTPLLADPTDGDDLLEPGELPIPIEQRDWAPCLANLPDTIGFDRALSHVAPGVYGDVTMRGAVRLRSGVYTFCDLNLDRRTKLMMQPDTEVRVWGNFRMPSGEFGDRTSRNAKLIVNGDTVAFGRGGVVAAQLFAPNARVGLGNQTDVYGRLWARSFSSDWGININADLPPSEQTTTTPPSTTPPSTTPPSTPPPTTTPPTTTPGTTTSSSTPEPTLPPT
ncbi:MAG: hypothetical protein ACT4OX_15340 [Actinomycetota bacterium]